MEAFFFQELLLLCSAQNFTHRANQLLPALSVVGASWRTEMPLNTPLLQVFFSLAGVPFFDWCLNSMSANQKLVALSEYISLTCPLLARNLLIVLRHASVSSEEVTFRCMTHMVKHVKITHYPFTFPHLLFTRNGLILSVPTLENGRSSGRTFHSGQSALSCLLACPYIFLQVTLGSTFL